MPKRAAYLPPTGMTLDPGASESLQRQIYQWIRQAILDGQLRAGQRLPSMRTLASELGVSRTTTSLAYAQLLAEGYIQSKVGQGTIVGPTILPSRLTDAKRSSEKSVVSRNTEVPETDHPSAASSSQLVTSEEALPVLSHAARMLVQRPDLPTRGGGKPRPFRVGVPALDAFPFKLWAQILARRARSTLPTVADYQDPVGYRPLREAIATHLALTRSVHCQPEQVIIVAGGQAGMEFVAQLLLDPGEQAWVEEPGYFGARKALASAGARLVPIPVGDEGLCVEVGRVHAPHARLAIVTPSHQSPLGMVMSLRQRLALLQWAEQADAWILEDDYDSEYRYSGRPVEALQGLDNKGRVIYLGTLSKVMFPALRLGYLVVPPQLVDLVTTLQWQLQRHVPILEQLALTDFIQEGHFARHIRHMRTLYKLRRDALVEALRQELGPRLQMLVSETGMHLVGQLPAHLPDVQVAQEAGRCGIELQPLSKCYLSPTGRQNGLILGYAAFNEQDIRASVHALADIVSHCEA
ncbi:MAG TPA: PLP-dependent aminotransferase family protein [Ktedonobacteraceae bacterium]|nr:PLP-dependent aminotransferase family protein [Ktedonobacteraceae bacterium]